MKRKFAGFDFAVMIDLCRRRATEGVIYANR